MNATILGLEIEGGEEVYALEYFDGEIDQRVPARMIRAAKNKDTSSPFDAVDDKEEDDYVEEEEEEEEVELSASEDEDTTKDTGKDTGEEVD